VNNIVYLRNIYFWNNNDITFQRVSSSFFRIFYVLCWVYQRNLVFIISCLNTSYVCHQ